MSLSEEIGRFVSTVSFLVGRGENSHPSPCGDKVYAGRVNRHTVTIKAKPQQVYQALIDFSEMQRWCPQEKILLEKITPGKLGLGTKIRYRLNYRINPIWHSVVVDMEEDSRIINRFVDGIFEGSAEIWQIKEAEEGVELSHTLIYRINGLIFRIGWIFLGGEAKHNELTEEALGNLKRIVEGKSHSSSSVK
jgi:uncharacterized protein YndB with AHSA1/START domain